MSDKLIIVSADGHTGPPLNAYRPYFESRHYAALDALQKESDAFVKMGISQSRFSAEKLSLIDERGAIRSGGLDGAWDLKRRLQELDGEGVAAEILIPGHQLSTLPFFSVMNAPASVELRTAGARAYHRWLADQMAGSGGRFNGVGEAGPCLDMDGAVAELRWLADHGFVSVSPPGTVADPALPPINDAYYDPFWRTCEELGLVLTVHGYGIPQMDHTSVMASMSPKAIAKASLSDEERLVASMTKERVANDGFLGRAIFATRRLIWQLMLGGVFDRFPGLKVVLTEIRADWVPGTLAHLDRAFAQSGVTSRMKPSEYWRRHCYVAPSSPRRYEVDMRHDIGVDRLMLGVDYPHPEGMWPNTLDWIRTAFDAVSEADARLMLGENAIACYGLDHDALAKVAARIGPIVESLLGAGGSVKRELVADFHLRSGYAAPAEVVDTGRLDDLLEEDFRMATAV